MKKELPTCFDGSHNETRAPYMSDKQAFGWKDKTKIEYIIQRELFGMSDESGEMLYEVEAEKSEQFLPEGDSFYSFRGFLNRKLKKLYVNNDGDAYTSWKGKLKGNPVCNFKKGIVYD